MNIKHLFLHLNEKQRSSQRRLSGYGYAIKEMRALLDPLNVEEIESSLTFIGFAGMIDPPRNEAKGSFSMHTSRNHPCNDYR
jgi:magnesium-transporting ATPase (P-type)